MAARPTVERIADTPGVPLMLPTRTFHGVLAVVGLSFCATSVSAAVLASRHLNLGVATVSRATPPPVDYSGNVKFDADWPFTFPQSPTPEYVAAPGLFSNLLLTPDREGEIIVATAATDPFFDATVAKLTDGVAQRVGHLRQWFPNPGTFITGSSTEAGYFDLPSGTIDFNGQTIGGIALQVNRVDIFPYVNRTSTRSPYSVQRRLDVTLIISDSASVTAPILPVAYAKAARANSFYVMPGEDMLLDASGSIGDIVKYEWDLNRDGVFEFATTDAQMLLTPAEYLPHVILDSSFPFILRVTDAAGATSAGTSDGVTVVPEPSAAAVAAACLAGVLAVARRRRARGEASRA